MSRMNGHVKRGRLGEIIFLYTFDLKLLSEFFFQCHLVLKIMCNLQQQKHKSFAQYNSYLNR